MKTKKCTKCHETKPLDKFNNRKAASDGKRSHCRDCQKVIMANWRSKNKEHEKMYKKENHEHLINKRREANGWKPQKHLLRNDTHQECVSCGGIKVWSEYGNWKNGFNGKANRCKSCGNKASKERRVKNRDEVLRKEAEYRNKNAKKLSEYSREWRNNNKDQYNLAIRKNRSKRYKEDPLFNLASRLRARIGLSFRNQGWTKRNSTYKLVGGDWETVKQHVESQFTEGMTWDNQGDWHIDHIIPLASANSEEELIKLNHYQNLQPLWAEDNMRKSDNMPPLCVQYKVHKAIKETISPIV